MKRRQPVALYRVIDEVELLAGATGIEPSERTAARHFAPPLRAGQFRLAGALSALVDARRWRHRAALVAVGTGLLSVGVGGVVAALSGAGGAPPPHLVSRLGTSVRQRSRTVGPLLTRRVVPIHDRSVMARNSGRRDRSAGAHQVRTLATAQPAPTIDGSRPVLASPTAEFGFER